MPEDDHAFLFDIEAGDLAEGCACIISGAPTAAEHIILRAAEHLLRRWYVHKTGTSVKAEPWGRVLNKLVKEFPDNKRPPELSLLSYLKPRRDSVAHPERVSTLSSAETTLLIVFQLVAEIRAVGVPGPMPSSAPVSSESPSLESLFEEPLVEDNTEK